jgi:hypothetical protein
MSQDIESWWLSFADGPRMLRSNLPIALRKEFDSASRLGQTPTAYPAAAAAVPEAVPSEKWDEHDADHDHGSRVHGLTYYRASHKGSVWGGGF